MRRAVAGIPVIVLVAGCGGSGATSGSAPVVTPPPVSTSTSARSESPHEINRNQSHAQLPGSPADFVRAALTTSDPKLACSAYTPQARDRAYGGQSGCEGAIGSGGAADSVQIKGVDSGLHTANVLAIPSGGPSNGETLRIGLLLAGNTWRIASIRSNVPVGP